MHFISNIFLLLKMLRSKISFASTMNDITKGKMIIDFYFSFLFNLYRVRQNRLSSFKLLHCMAQSFFLPCTICGSFTCYPCANNS